MIFPKQSFEDACLSIQDEKSAYASIGEYMERSIHAILKNYFENDLSKQEVKVESFICDIKNEYGIIEIQTRSFDKMRKKLEKLLENNEITIVYPIIVNKKIVYTDENEEKVRLSPVHKTIFSAFKELYKIKTLLNSKNLHFHFVYLETAEIKKGNRVNKYKQIKKKTIDSIPLKILKEESFDSYLDFARIFDHIEDTFTSKSIAALKKAKKEDVQVCMTVLNYLGVIRHIDTIKRCYVYKLND